MFRQGCLGVALLIALVLSSGPLAAADQRQVGSPAALSEALAAATGGMQITLAGGDYGILGLRDLVLPAAAPLVLRSADPANPARFSGMTLRGVRNVVFDGVLFDYTFQDGDKLSLRPFQILSSTGITIRNALFDGDRARKAGPAADGFPAAFGLGVRWSSGITLENSEIRGFFRGLVISGSSGVTVRGNDLHDIRMDGMNFAQVTQVVIENNHIHDFARSLESRDHADMIQFWTSRTDAPSRDVVIRNNLLNSGRGWFTQSIFMRNEQVDTGRAGTEMFYRDITIEGNLIINAHLHGITVGATDGLTIRNNTVVRNARSEGKKKNVKLWTPQIRVSAAARNVQLLRNVTSRIVTSRTKGPQDRPDWRVEDNLLVQDHARMKPGFYGTVFVPDALADPTRPGSFRPLPGGPLDGTGIGAQW